MPFEIVRNDITNMKTDAVVNTANPDSVIGAGVDAAIHKKAGPGLLAARKEIGCIKSGESAVTPAFDLDAKYVIHTVGPVWIDGRHHEEDILASCYRSALKAAKDLRCESIVFPLISAGTYRFPRPLALQIAVREISAFLMDHEMQIYLAVFDKEAFALSEKLFKSVSSYIDENYVRDKTADEYAMDREGGIRAEARRIRDRQKHDSRIKDAEEASQSSDKHQSMERFFCGSVKEAEEEQPCDFQNKEHFFGSSMRKAEKARPDESMECFSGSHIKEADSDKLQEMERFSDSFKRKAEKAVSLQECELLPAKAPMVSSRDSLEEILAGLDAGFSETLLHLIDKTGKKDSEIYKRANVDRKLFSKIRNNINYKPSKTTALAFAFALELDIEETRDFIARAGFALSHSSKFDVIVEYFLINKNYDVFELNEVLFAFDQPLIGA